MEPHHDDGESVIDDLDVDKARRALQESRRVNVDLPVWMVEQLDREAKRQRLPSFSFR